MPAGNVDDALQRLIHLGFRSFHFDNQERTDIQWIAGRGKGLANVNRLLVHKFDGHRDDAGRNDIGT